MFNGVLNNTGCNKRRYFYRKRRWNIVVPADATENAFSIYADKRSRVHFIRQRDDFRRRFKFCEKVDNSTAPSWRTCSPSRRIHRFNGIERVKQKNVIHLRRNSLILTASVNASLPFIPPGQPRRIKPRNTLSQSAVN